MSIWFLGQFSGTKYLAGTCLLDWPVRALYVSSFRISYSGRTNSQRSKTLVWGAPQSSWWIMSSLARWLRSKKRPLWFNVGYFAKNHRMTTFEKQAYILFLLQKLHLQYLMLDKVFAKLPNEADIWTGPCQAKVLFLHLHSIRQSAWSDHPQFSQEFSENN